MGLISGGLHNDMGAIVRAHEDGNGGATSECMKTHPTNVDSSGHSGGTSQR